MPDMKVTLLATEEKTSSVKYVPADGQGFPMPHGHGFTSAIYIFKHALAALQGKTNADVAQGKLPIPETLEVTISVPAKAKIHEPRADVRPDAAATHETVGAA